MTQRAPHSSGEQIPGTSGSNGGTGPAMIDAGAELDPVHPVELPTPPVNTRGLTAAEVAERIARGEVNDVPVRSSRSVREIVRANVFTRFNLIIGVLWLITSPIAVGTIIQVTYLRMVEMPVRSSDWTSVKRDASSASCAA